MKKKKKYNEDGNTMNESSCEREVKMALLLDEFFYEGTKNYNSNTEDLALTGFANDPATFEEEIRDPQ